MRKLVLIAAATALVGCSQNLPNYAEMSFEQKEAFMADYEKDMMKVYSGANRMGKITTLVKADPKNDRITTTMTLDMDMKGAGGDVMAKQISEMMLEQNCQEKMFKEFVEVGISYRMVMKDAGGRTVVNTVVSPKKCAKYLAS